jgi:hypothetical protein
VLVKKKNAPFYLKSDVIRSLTVRLGDGKILILNLIHHLMNFLFLVVTVDELDERRSDKGFMICFTLQLLLSSN